MVEEDKERPVNQPCPLLERLERGADRLDRTETKRKIGKKVKDGGKPGRDRQKEKKR